MAQLVRNLRRPRQVIRRANKPRNRAKGDGFEVVVGDLQVSGKLNRNLNLDLPKDVKAHLDENGYSDVIVLPARDGERSPLISGRMKRQLTCTFVEGVGVVPHTTTRATSKARSLTVQLEREGRKVTILSVTASPTESVVPPRPAQLLKDLNPSTQVIDFAASAAFWSVWVLGDVI